MSNIYEIITPVFFQRIQSEQDELDQCYVMTS